MKIVFMGTPDFAESSLKAVYEAGHEILAVVTNPDKPSGRGMKLTASPVKQYALEKELSGVKVLGNGEISKKLTVRANKFSAVAKEKIETAGGKAEVM